MRDSTAAVLRAEPDMAAELADELAARAQVRGRREPSELVEHLANVRRLLAALEQPRAASRRPSSSPAPRPLPTDVHAMLATLRDALERVAPAERATIRAGVVRALRRFRAGSATLAELVGAIASASTQTNAARSAPATPQHRRGP